MSIQNKKSGGKEATLKNTVILTHNFHLLFNPGIALSFVTEYIKSGNLEKISWKSQLF